MGLTLEKYVVIRIVAANKLIDNKLIDNK